jgi:hypothetical protein
MNNSSRKSSNKEKTIFRISPTSMKTYQNSAANKIQNFFKSIKAKRKHLIDLLGNPESSCIQEPIPIGNENVYMYLNVDSGKEIPLFTIFNFHPNSSKSRTQKSVSSHPKTTTISPIKDAHFFERFHAVLRQMDERVRHLTVNFSIAVHATKEVPSISIYYYPDFGFYNITDNKLLVKFFYPYLLFVLANSKMNFEKNAQYYLKIDQPSVTNFVTAGFHKDDSLRTLITYVNSPVSTELVFHDEAINARVTSSSKTPSVPWLTCSPIFRFDTRDKLYTLCFNDKYMHHTPPIYEEEGKPLYETNILETPDNIQRIIDSKGEKMKTTQLINGKHVPKEYPIPKSRRFVSKLKTNRMTIASFVYEGEDEDGIGEDNLEDGITIPISELEQHKMRYQEEKIELTEDSIRIITEEEYLGTVRQTGGSQKRKPRKNRTTRRR